MSGYFATGVADVEEAQAGLDFAKRFEIIKGSEVKNIRLQAVDLSDESAIADALPRYAAAGHHLLCSFIATLRAHGCTMLVNQT